MRRFYTHIIFLLLQRTHRLPSEAILFIKLISFGCAGSSLRHLGFLYLRGAGAPPHYTAWAFHCGGLSGLMGFSSCSLRALECRLSSCSTTCGIFPDQGWNPYPLNWQEDFYPLDHQGSPLRSHSYEWEGLMLSFEKKTSVYHLFLTLFWEHLLLLLIFLRYQM